MAGHRLIVIRPMRPDDLAAVLTIERSTFPQPWSEGVFRQELAAPQRVYLIAETAEGDVGGYAGMMLVGEDAHVTTMAVIDPQRGRGLGTRLMLELVERGIVGGARHLTLEVRFSNRPAQELYRKFGLAPVGMRKHYYLDEDALIMWAHDIDQPAYQERLQQIRGGLP